MQTELDLCPWLLGWLSLCLSCSHSLQPFPRCLNAQTPSVHFRGPVRELCLVKNNAIHGAERAEPLCEQAATSRGIVTRCKGGNTWSIPRCRNVFISLFTNVAISRCVHFKVHCSTGSPSSGAWLQWGTCAEAQASLFEQLAQFSPACTCARRSEGVVPHRVRKNTGFQQDRLYLIQCHHIKRLARGSTISTATRWKADGKVGENDLTLRWWWRCSLSGVLWDLVMSFKNLQQVVSGSPDLLVWPWGTWNAVSFVENNQNVT